MIHDEKFVLPSHPQVDISRREKTYEMVEDNQNMATS